jgi:hypothetical protein
MIRIREKYPGLIVRLKCCPDHHDAFDESVPTHLQGLEYRGVGYLQHQLDQVLGRSSTNPDLDAKWRSYVKHAVEEMRIGCARAEIGTNINRLSIWRN